VYGLILIVLFEIRQEYIPHIQVTSNYARCHWQCLDSDSLLVPEPVAVAFLQVPLLLPMVNHWCTAYYVVKKIR